MIRRHRLLTILGFLSLSVLANADSYFYHEFRFELEPKVRPEPYTADEGREALLREAQWVFSGMLYGFRFRYVPADQARAVAEVFEINPIATIPWGDPALSVTASRLDGGWLVADILFELDESDGAWLRRWQDSSYEDGAGVGYAPYYLGSEQRIVAMEQGVKDGIRSALRTETPNKPREIRGEAVLSQAPTVIVDAGQYRAAVRILVDIGEVVPYLRY